MNIEQHDRAKFVLSFFGFEVVNWNFGQRTISGPTAMYNVIALHFKKENEWPPVSRRRLHYAKSDLPGRERREICNPPAK